jgi:tRNA(fMet)-specific endonuclease VapC
MYALDTNTCIYFLKGTYLSVLDEFASRHPADIKIPSMVKAELLYGAEKSIKRKENLSLCHEFLRPYEILSFDDEAALFYSTIRSTLEKKGKSIGPNDLIIAATVCAIGGILVTNNVKEFRVVPHLQIENWVR